MPSEKLNQGIVILTKLNKLFSNETSNCSQTSTCWHVRIWKHPLICINMLAAVSDVFASFSSASRRFMHLFNASKSFAYVLVLWEGWKKPVANKIEMLKQPVMIYISRLTGCSENENFGEVPTPTCHVDPCNITLTNISVLNRVAVRTMNCSVQEWNIEEIY